MSKYVNAKEAKELLGVSIYTLRNWEKDGHIEAIRTPGGQRRYCLDSLKAITEGGFGIRSDVVTTVCYARVSTTSQKDDLERQSEYLLKEFPEAELISEVASGLNFKRRKFLAILERISQGNIQRLVVAYQDRLVRFGFDLIEWFCKQNGCELVVLSKENLSPEQELVQDMLSIVDCFSSRLYGLRKYRQKVEQILQENDAPL